MDSQLRQIAKTDPDLAFDLYKRDLEMLERRAKIANSLKSLKKVTKKEYLHYLYLHLKAGNESRISTSWSNYIFRDMYYVDRDFKFTVPSYGASAPRFLVGHYAKLSTPNTHEIVYDCNNLNNLREDQEIPVPVECYRAYRLMKKNLNLYENFVTRFFLNLL